MGINLLAVDLILNCAITATAISASSAAEVLLVIAYLVIPGAAGRLISASIGRMCVISILVAVLGEWLEMHLMLVPTPRPVSPQVAVILSITAFLMLITTELRIYTVLRRIMAPRTEASTKDEL